ncbi:MAG: VOC family protein [Chloroflexi bacterium]|nr:VOC family protein [Chloroflexota bacterium]MCI0644529.1 VOC family protein [Chloroflexota bacterium]MCI0728782.1 VOC family protein [Chloroflexota bacterium]
MTFPAKIGHAHLKVRDLERAVEFYTHALNLRVNDRWEEQYVFLTGTEMHHEIALQRVGPEAPDPPPHGVGLYHVAFEVPDKRAFALAVQHLRQMGVEVATVDHVGISWAMYFSDPDGNGLEIYWDSRGGDTSRRWLGNRPIPEQELLDTLTG